MQAVKPMQIGVMFWAGKDPDETLAALTGGLLLLSAEVLGRWLMADEQAAECFPAEEHANHNRGNNGDQRRKHHFLDGALGHDVNAFAVFRLGGAFHDAGDIAELAANFLNNTTGCLANRFHQE